MLSNIPTTAIDRTRGKKATAVILDELWLSMPAAVSVFLKALIRKQGMPFEMRIVESSGKIWSSCSSCAAKRND